jgi:tripeptide aminopeptidase
MAVVERFKRLTAIDNPSGHEEALRNTIAEALTALGVTDQTVDPAGNLFVRVPGAPERETILLSAHMDSVPPCHGIVAVEDEQDGRRIVRSEGKTILGADDKSGVAVILEVVEALSRQGFKENHPLELMFSTGEEVGLIGAKAFDMGQVKAAYGYVLDGEGSVGDIFNGGPSQENIRIVCQGRRSHAGIAPEDGISAIRMAASLCAKLPSGRLGPVLTANLGVMKGGAAMNIVAPETEIRGEARSHEEPLLADLLSKYRETCRVVEQAFPGSTVEMETVRRYDCFTVAPELPVVTRAEAACRELGVASRVLPMNIGSDAHVFNHKGLPVVVLGMGFHYSHSLGEFLYADELETVLRLTLRLVGGNA